ncbi:unnamed protein product, partial [Penicillium nalgiovense]
DSLVYPFAVWVPLADHVDAGRDSCWATSASSRLFVTVAAEQPVPALMRPKDVRSSEILIWTMLS